MSKIVQGVMPPANDNYAPEFTGWYEKERQVHSHINLSNFFLLRPLYPLRIKNYRNYSTVNFDRWEICKAGELMGKREHLPIYKFLKEPLIRRFGEEWYKQLELVATEWLKKKKREEEE